MPTRVLAAESGMTFEFESVLRTSLIALAVLVVLHVVVFIARRNRGSLAKFRWSLPERLLYVLFASAVALLGGTAFYSMLALHGMHGWWLLAHMCGAGVFVGALIIMSWTLSFRFMIAGLPSDGSGQERIRFPTPIRVMYWIVLLLSIPVVGTMLLSMFPLAGTEELLELIEIHRYSGLALFSAVAVQCLLIMLPPR